jgi:hypothetical protein
MIFRVFAASIVVLGIATMAAPIETSARSGGFVSASSLGARSFVRPAIATPFSAHAFRPEGMRPLNGFHTARQAERQRAERQSAERQSAERQSPGSPWWWGYGSDLPSYYPGEYSYGGFPYPYPAENFSERSRPIVTYQPGCRTETQKVPSEGGGERSINITRCY